MKHPFILHRTDAAALLLFFETASIDQKSWEVGGMICKVTFANHSSCKSLLPPPLSSPLDQHRVAQIEVYITERLVST
jgi:hypothetical protein